MHLFKTKGLPKLILGIVLILLTAWPTFAKEPDATIKIAKLEEALTLVQRLGMATQSSGGFNPVSQFTAMLQGTDWIDPRRSIVIGVSFENNQPKGAVLIPFILPNEQFQKQMGAKKGSGYYILPVPPIPDEKVDRGMERALAAESKKPPESMVVADFFVGRLLSQFRPQIQEGLDKLEALPTPSQSGSAGQPPIGGQDISQMAKNMLSVAEQLNLLSIMIDADQEEMTLSIGLKADPKTQLATLFSKKNNQYHLNGYSPRQQIKFSSMGYDVKTMMALLQSTMGDFYAKMGIDFSQIVELMAYTDGEMAGGMTMKPDGELAMEAIMVLNEKTGSKQYLEKVYVPWLKNYAVSMAQMMEKATGQKVDLPISVKTTGKVQGLPVYQVSMEFPTGMPESKEMSPMAAMFGYNMRMAQLDRFLIMAESDQRLSQLITTARNQKVQTVDRPLMVIDVDLESYMKTLARMMPQGSGSPALPNIRGSVRITSDMQNGQATSVVSIPMTMFEDFAKLESRKQGISAPTSRTVRKQPASPRASTQTQAPTQTAVSVKPKLDETQAEYWLQKGLLSSTYGSPTGALRHFKRTLKIDPQNVHALFQSGIAQAELGQYQTALALINQAMTLSQSNSGDHYYGRGWVYFLAGQPELAMQDFRFAALQGDQDAIAFLNR